MGTRTKQFVLALIATLIVASSALMAQTGGGATLVGTVKDSTGATVAGAKVTVVNTETAFVTETTTKDDGGYYLPYLAPIESAKVPAWDMGQRFPTAAQTPYFDMNTFAYPDSYMIGTLGSRVIEAPALLWMQYFATKSWTYKERLKISFRIDGHNLPWKRPNLAAPNTQYNQSNTAAWGKFTGVVGDFSNFGTAQANTQMSIRAEF